MERSVPSLRARPGPALRSGATGSRLPCLASAPPRPGRGETGSVILPSFSRANRPAVALLIRRGPIEGTSAAGEGSGFGSGSGTWPFDASRAARRLPRDSETAVACRHGGLPDHKSRGGPTAWARSLSPRPPCPGTCRLRAEGLTTRWLPAPSVHAVSAAGPGSVCACPALRGKSPVDLPLRAPGRHLSAGFDCLPGLSANQRGLVSKRPTKTQK